MLQPTMILRGAGIPFRVAPDQSRRPGALARPCPNSPITLGTRSWPYRWRALAWLAVCAAAIAADLSRADDAIPTLEAGIAVRDITPVQPVWLAGYAARTHPFEKVDTRLLVQAIALRSRPGDPVVLVSLDNCEVNREVMAPVVKALASRHGLGPGRVIIVSSHTHSAPVVDGPLLSMYPLSPSDREAVTQYCRLLQTRLIDVVDAALQDLKPAWLEHGTGQARFAMNRRVYREDQVVFGEDPDGPVDWDVPVLRVRGASNEIRAVLFGYACHGTSIAGDDFYTVSGDYMAYARQHLEALYPGTVAAYITGMGADSNPSPRNRLLDAKRHGLELAGAVSGILSRPMRPVQGVLKFAYTEIDLPLKPAPNREQLETDRKSNDKYIQKRAQSYLDRLDRGESTDQVVKLPLAIVRIGEDLTFVAMAGEVVVDYGIRLRRLLAADHPWLIGYAYEVPCYIPSIRILKEGGYEAESSLIYYGQYGPFQTGIEELILRTVVELSGQVRASRN